MMPNITRGDRMGGLLVYLAGPGRRNEHTEPHLVAGDPALMAWYDDNELGHEDALAIARHLDRPRRAFDVEVRGGHVWHCSLSLRAEEGRLTDERWREISESFVRRMGLDDQEGTKAPTRWIAFRHGVSSAGNDHVHLVVNLVREDGTKADVWGDFRDAQRACRGLEVEFGLQRLESAQHDRASRGYHPAEIEADARRRARGKFEAARRAGTESRTWWSLGKDEREDLVSAQRAADQPRWALARVVRACATASADEAEFVRRMRRQGVLVRARYAEGTRDVVTGYSVAARPEPGQRPIWYGGGHLARDLTLPRLRAEWPDTPQGASAAAAEWGAARRGRRPVAPGREAREPDPALWREVGADLDRLRDQLRSVPVDDREVWARVARQTAGAFAAWSVRVEVVPGPLAATADVLARSAELRRKPGGAPRAGLASASGAATLLGARTARGREKAVQAVMLRQLANLSRALFDAHRAMEDAQRAAAIERAIRRDLAVMAARLPDPSPSPGPVSVSAGHADAKAVEAVRLARQAHGAPLRQVGSPVPRDLDGGRARPVAPAGAGRDQGRDTGINR
ncbi:relaxase/mobilization nuclease domain-containing protein [Arsenicicoccus dermatophilus]|uniref:relaxase/mobilization nuclease domain-containing protein n=1 Tax=Arsenicicoccus dermatophilus TaxID=1076331 RepID=UPI001F4D1343|nr:relaxase [Arsenicicoccus dermatophilus]MCH8614404.1 relaxase [Arsenicicoccus dermatophilus]